MSRIKAQLRLAEAKASPLRRWMVRRRMLPLSPVGRFFWRVLAVAFVLSLLTKITGTSGLIGGFVAVCSALSYVVAVPVGMYILSRWLLTGVLWRLRNRLIVTYLFIGGAPLLLVLTLALISAYFMSGQFAAFLATSDLHARLQEIAVENKSVAAHLVGDARLSRADLADVPELRNATSKNGRVIEIFQDSAQATSVIDGGNTGRFTRPAWLHPDFTGIVHDSGKLYFRACHSFSARGHTYTVASSEPLDSDAMTALLSGLGEITLYGTGLVANNNGDFVAVDQQQAEEMNKEKAAKGAKQASIDAKRRTEAESIHSGALPGPKNTFDRSLQYISPLAVIDWNAGKEDTRALSVKTRPSVLYARLFNASTIWGTTLRNVLFGTTIFFGFLEVFALFIGMRLTRSVTHAVHELYSATQHIEKGDFRHRIRIRSKDQLAALEGSFNNMSESLERLLQEQREKERLQSELAIAQEVQEQLYPRAWSSNRYLDLFGVCRPARSVSGDYYDFLSLGASRTAIAVGDVSGKGISAALLMATIQSAVRSYEFGVDEQPRMLASGAVATGTTLMTQSSVVTEHAPSETMWLLNRHLYRSTPPEKYATMFFGVYDGGTRTLSYTNAGHLPPIIIRSNGYVERLEISGTVIGLFETMDWQQSELVLAPGDIVVAYSDGVTEPENEYGEFGDDRLIELLRSNRTLPLDEIARRTIAAVEDWIGENEQPDDITIVLARAGS
ncbi:MAG: hypothetical protein NVS9B15_01220 [Acidobacteriaceae bacterium]